MDLLIPIIHWEVGLGHEVWHYHHLCILPAQMIHVGGLGSRGTCGPWYTSSHPADWSRSHGALYVGTHSNWVALTFATWILTSHKVLTAAPTFSLCSCNSLLDALLCSSCKLVPQCYLPRIGRLYWGSVNIMMHSIDWKLMSSRLSSCHLGLHSIILTAAFTDISSRSFSCHIMKEMEFHSFWIWDLASLTDDAPWTGCGEVSMFNGRHADQLLVMFFVVYVWNFPTCSSRAHQHMC